MVEKKEGDQPEQKKFAFVQWFDKRPRGPLGFLNKLRCAEILVVPKSSVQAGAKEFIYNRKTNQNQPPLRALMYSSWESESKSYSSTYQL